MAPPITPPIPHEDPDTSVGPLDNQEAPVGYQITTQPMTTPWLSSWYKDDVISEIPKDSVGWLLAQGYVIDSIQYDETTKPQTPYFTMKRRSLQHDEIIQSLLGEYVFAYNSALQNNNVRYNNVLVDWDSMIASTQTQFIEQATAQTDHAAAYLSVLGVAMDTVKTLIEDNKTDLVVDMAVSTTALTAMDSKLDDLETNVGTSTTTIEGLLTDQAGYLTTFLADFIAKRVELDTNYTAHLTEIVTLLQDADADLSTFSSEQSDRLREFETAYATFAIDLGSVFTIAGTNLADIVTDIGDILDDISADYDDVETEVTALLTDGVAALTAHTSDYNSVLATLESDYALHSPTATAFLNDLGATELARINEKFVASFSTQIQQLVDRGLYSAAVAADITARNTRDHNEEIVALNDRLNREKFDNQHQLYGQQVAMRKGAMEGKDRIHGLQQELLRYRASQIVGLHELQQSLRDRTMNGKQAIHALKEVNLRLKLEIVNQLYVTGQEMRRLMIDEAARLQQLGQVITQWKAGQRDRLLEQIQNIVTQHLAGLAQQHTAEQAVSGAAISERNILLQQLQDAVQGFLGGKDRYVALTAQNAVTLTEQRHRMIAEKMNEIGVRTGGDQKKHEEDMAVMAYQLAARNELLIGLFGLVERREDIGPSMNDLSKLMTSLGDSGGGWITP